MLTICNLKRGTGATLSFQNGNKRIVGTIPFGCIVNVPSHYIPLSKLKGNNKYEGIFIMDGKYPVIKVNDHVICHLSEVFNILKMNIK